MVITGGKGGLGKVEEEKGEINDDGGRQGGKHHTI